jgi:hypothetical protein
MNTFLLVGLVILLLLFIYLLTIVDNDTYFPITTQIPDNLPTYQCLPNLVTSNENSFSEKNDTLVQNNYYTHRPNNYKLLNATVDPIEI